MRASGQVPAVLFGHGDAQLIQVPQRALNDFLRHHAASGIVDVSLQSGATPALIREIDRDPVNGQVIHLGLQRVDMQETLKASVPIVFTGEDALTAEGLVFQRQLEKIEVHARADDLPESITVDVSQMTAGHSIRLADLSLPAGVETSLSPDQPLASVTMPSIPADVAAALDAEEIAHAELVASHGTADADEEETTEEAAAAA
jgi:large subunit ribosomal protein L25